MAGFEQSMEKLGLFQKRNAVFSFNTQDEIIGCCGYY